MNCATDTRKNVRNRAEALFVQTLLICGILSSLLYILLNLTVPLFWPAYHSVSQTVSELSAIGAPTRTLWNWLCAPYIFLVLTFAWGVRRVAGNNRPLRRAGALLVAYGTLGLLWPFAPMHLREMLAAGGATFSDTLHIALGAITEILFLLALVFAAGAFGRTFRLYSIFTLVLLLVFGMLTFLEAPRVAKNLPTPFIGIWERINIGVFLLWMIVLAVMLLKREQTLSRNIPSL